MDLRPTCSAIQTNLASSEKFVGERVGSSHGDFALLFMPSTTPLTKCHAGSDQRKQPRRTQPVKPSRDRERAGLWVRPLPATGPHRRYPAASASGLSPGTIAVGAAVITRTDVLHQCSESDTNAQKAVSE